LIRRESRSGAQWYELAHDRLVAPVINANKEWRDAHLNAFQRQAGLWGENGRRPGLLGSGGRFQEGGQGAEAHPGELTMAERMFLEACQAAHSRIEEEEKRIVEKHEREREREKRRRIRNRIVIVVAAISFLVSLVLVYLVEDALIAKKRAHE